MQTGKKQNVLASAKILFIKTNDIKPNPMQPRKVFDKEALYELAQSIEQHGILQPLTVRRIDDSFQLVAGERRLRAAGMVGLTEVPCIVVEASGQQSSLLALIENLQRKDLDYIEEAEGIARLMRIYGLSQDEVAKRIGKSQPTVANKLRLLKLSQTSLLLLREHGLTERHARALLKLGTENERLEVLQAIINGDLNVSKTEALIDRMLCKDQPQEEKGKCTYIIKDIKIFMNSIDHSLEVMKNAGVDAKMSKKETEEEIFLEICIPKMQTKAAKGA